MGRFFLFILFLLFISLGFCITAQLDFKSEEISISGSVFLADKSNPDGIKIKIIRPKSQIFTKEINNYCLTDSSGNYYFKNLRAPKGLVGKAFLLWLNGDKEWSPHLRLRLSKEGYLPTDIIIVKYKPDIMIPSITLDNKQQRCQLNQLIYENNQIKILKNVTDYYFCPIHNYFWFYPQRYDIDIVIPTEDKKEIVEAKIRFIIQPIYTTFREEIEGVRHELINTVQRLIPNISQEQVKIYEETAIANLLSNQSLINKLNLLLHDSKIKHIQLLSANLRENKEKIEEE